MATKLKTEDQVKKAVNEISSEKSYDELEIGDVHLDKEERRVRRQVYDRFYAMRDDSLRKDKEQDWKEADKAFRQYVEPKDADDWRADLKLPDAFAAIQADAQETIDRKSRPKLELTEDSDRPKEDFGNAVLNHNMDRTDFDYEYYLAKLNAGIKGESFLWDYYRYEERKVQDPILKDDGELDYQEKIIIDYDDDYVEFVENEFSYVDPDASQIKYANDCIRREVLDIHTFRNTYMDRSDFDNVEFVKPGGDTGDKAYFKMPEDLDEDQVEILHYYNKSDDEYLVLANDIPVRIGPLPSKHKELPVSMVYHYRVPGYLWGIGIPKIIFGLSEERRTIRNMNLDRQKMQINKMFIYNRGFDLDEEELISRPHGLIGVDTQGLPLNQVMQPLEYGDVPPSYFRTEEILLEDIRRAHGIDDRIQGVNVGGTATEAAILKESALKRVNMVSKLNEMDSLKRLGRLKWSNIQFFYPAKRFERIVKEGGDEKKEVIRKISVKGKQFRVEEGDKGPELNVDDIQGKSALALDKKMARYLEGDWDVQIDASAFEKVSKPIKQAKITEMFTAITSKPALAGTLDPKKSVTRYIEINDEDPKEWLLGDGRSDAELMELAELENEVMAKGQPLAPTDGANEAHTMVHLMFTETARFEQLDEATKEIFESHISGENDKNPGVPDTADLEGETQPDGGGGPGGGFLPSSSTPSINTNTAAGPQVQPADLQPSNQGGEE